MRRFAIIFALLWAVASAAESQIERPGAFETVSACRGLSCLWSLDRAAHLHQGPYEFFTVDPADRSSNGKLIVMKGDRKVLETRLDDLSASISMTWAEGLGSFAVTWSDGGGLGGFHVKVFTWNGTGFVETPTPNKALTHFRALHNCKARGDNEQAYRFEGRGSELFLILSVYNSSDCGLEMGHTEGYLVRVKDGTILRCYSTREMNLYITKHPEGS